MKRDILRDQPEEVICSWILRALPLCCSCPYLLGSHEERQHEERCCQQASEGGLHPEGENRAVNEMQDGCRIYIHSCTHFFPSLESFWHYGYKMQNTELSQIKESVSRWKGMCPCQGRPEITLNYNILQNFLNRIQQKGIIEVSFFHQNLFYHQAMVFDLFILSRVAFS